MHMQAVTQQEVMEAIEIGTVIMHSLKKKATEKHIMPICVCTNTASWNNGDNQMDAMIRYSLKT